MINIKKAHRYCKEDIALIENYEEAISDTTQMWECHHRDEVRVLPSGMVAIRSYKELIEMGRYYKCPANELIFLTQEDHVNLHKPYRDHTKFLEAAHAATKIKLKGRPRLHTEFAKKYYEKYHLLKNENENLYCKEYRFYKKHGIVSWEYEGVVTKAFSEFGKAFVEHYGFGQKTDKNLYNREFKFHKKYGKFSWED